MWAEALAVSGLIGAPFASGFASRFVDRASLRRLVISLAFLPVLLFASYAALAASRPPLVGDAGILLVALGICGLFLYVGRAFGRPFAEIRDEWRRERTRKVFD